MEEPHHQHSHHHLLDFAKRHRFDVNKQYFPVNTMRLLYLFMTDGLTGGNQKAINLVNQVIPKLVKVFNTRDDYLSTAKRSNPTEEIKACTESLNQVFSIIDNPLVRHTFDLLFSDLYPLQENLLFALDRHLNEELLTPSDLHSILKIRAMDSVVYSTVIHEIIKQHQGNTLDLNEGYLTTPIHWQVNLTLQTNDLCDAIIHAKEDLTSGSATLIQIVKKIVKKPEELEPFVNQLFSNLKDNASKLPLPDPLQDDIHFFNLLLKNSITGKNNTTY